jgi:hypothetical protein
MKSEFKAAFWAAIILLTLMVIAALIVRYLEYQLDKHAVWNTAEAITRGEA